jgi:hypothetical protein
MPITFREYDPAFMHHGNGGAGYPLLVQVTPDNGIKSAYRTWKISLFEHRSIWMKGTAIQAEKAKRDQGKNNYGQPFHG